MGESADGHLVVLVAMRPTPEPVVAEVVALSGAFDLETLQLVRSFAEVRRVPYQSA
jgi:acetyl esterase/lipase